MALACAHPAVHLVARTRQNSALLWERGPDGAYAQLFGQRPTAIQIWRSVEVFRAVQREFQLIRDERSGRAAAIAEQGSLLVAHIFFQHVGLDGVDDHDVDWESRLATLPTIVRSAVDWLIYSVDSEFGTNSFPSSTFANVDRCATLVGLVLAALRDSGTPPKLPASYVPVRTTAPRRRATVGLLVDAGLIKEGTRLVFSTSGKAEEAALRAWLEADPRRAEATWVNNRGKPLLWAADGRRYAPTRLVLTMWSLAGWKRAPVAVQGPLRWSIPSEGSLVDLVEAHLRAEAQEGTASD